MAKNTSKSNYDDDIYTFKAGWLQTLTFFAGVLLSVLSIVGALQVVYVTPPLEVKSIVNNYHSTLAIMSAEGASFEVMLNFKIAVSKLVLSSLWYLWLLPITFMVITVMTVLSLNYRSVAVTLIDKVKQYRYMYTQERQRKKHALAELERSEEHLYKVHEQLSEAFIVLNKDERVVHGNRLAIQYLAKWSKGSRNIKSYRGQLLETYVPGYLISGLSVSVRDAINKKLTWQKEIHLEALDTWLDVRIYPSADDGAYIYFRDITDSKLGAGLAGGQSDVVLKNITENAPMPIAIVDRQWNYLVVSNNWKETFAETGEDIIGQNHRAILPNFPGRWQALEKELLQGRSVKANEMALQLGGREEWLSWEIRPWEIDGKIQGYMIFANVITDIRGAQERSEEQRERERKLAYHDILTGLPNRQLFYDRLSMALAHAYRHLGKVSLFFLDLDGFKGINDNLGHDVGDMLLQETAERLKQCVRDTDTVARLGGDEFTVILNGISDEKDAALVADKIIKSINKVFLLSGHEVHVSTSIGISLYPSDGTTVNELIKKADTAMYWSKEGGKNQYTFHSSGSADLNETPSQAIAAAKAEEGEQLTQRELEGQIRIAQQKGEMEIYFQPQYNAEENKVIGMESLLRWNHPVLGKLRPASFLNMAETTGAILPLGEWVIRETCAKVKEWKETYSGQPVQFSINFSKRQLLDESMLTRVQNAFAGSNVSMNCMIVEISEKLIMENEDEVREAVRHLASLGCRIYVDDFGLHYTPMASLQQWPLSGIKVHRSFVQNALQSAEDKSVLKAIYALAESLELDIISEGVENEEHLKFLMSIEQPNMQGYYIAEPMQHMKIPPFFEERVISGEGFIEEDK